MSAAIQVLLVEDDDVDAMVVKRDLKKCNVDVALDRVSDGVEAFEYLQNAQTLPGRPARGAGISDRFFRHLGSRQM